MVLRVFHFVDKVTRSMFGEPNMRTFILEDFLSSEECEQLIHNSELAGTKRRIFFSDLFSHRLQ